MGSLKGVKLGVNKSVTGTSGAQKKLRATEKTEVYIGQVKSESATLTKASEKSTGGRMQLMLQLAPIDGEGKVRFPTVPLFIKVPQPTPPEVFEAFSQAAVDDDGNARGQDVDQWEEEAAYKFLKATGREEIAVPTPKWNKDAKQWEDQLTDATYKSKDDMKERLQELMEPVHQFYLDTFAALSDKDDKAEIFKGNKVAFTLAYGADGKGFPNVKIISGADNIPAEYTVIENINDATVAE